MGQVKSPKQSYDQEVAGLGLEPKVLPFLGNLEPFYVRASSAQDAVGPALPVMRNLYSSHRRLPRKTAGGSWPPVKLSTLYFYTCTCFIFSPGAAAHHQVSLK